MAVEKQERLLRQLPPIVVATPGRLWKLMSEVIKDYIMRIQLSSVMM